MKVGGKLIRKSLETDSLSVAKLRLGDLDKSERQAIESKSAVKGGKMTLGQALLVHRNRLAGDVSLKPRTKAYYEERITALLKSWPKLEATDLRKLTKADCLSWASEFGKESSPSAFNHTVSLLRHIIDIGVEMGTCYSNPARHIKRKPERPKKLELPEFSQFTEFVVEIAHGGGGFSKSCADLVCFLAYGGFRKTEATHILGSHCDFTKKEILVYGDPVTATKNNSFRRVPMIPEMAELLERLKSEKQADDWAEKPVMNVRECQKAMNRAAEAIGMTRITHHDLRHLFATRCIESGVDIPTVAKWLGHKDGGALAMKTYGHLRNEHSQEMAKKVSFSAKPATQPSLSERAPAEAVA
jgi:integrase